MAVIQGLVTRDNLLGARRQRAVNPKLWWLDANNHQLVILTGGLVKSDGNGGFTVMGKAGQAKIGWRPVSNVQYEFNMREPLPYRTRINAAGGYTATATSLTVDDSTFLAVTVNHRAQLKNPRTGELMYVTSAPTSTTVTVSRAAASTTARAILDNDQLIWVSTMARDGSSSLPARSQLETTDDNFIQEFEHDWHISNLALGSAYHGPHQASVEKSAAMFEFFKQIERQFLFGHQANPTINSGTAYSTGGLESILTTNIFDLGGASNGLLTLPEFDAIAGQVLRYGSRTKFLLCGQRVANAINSFLDGSIRYEGDADAGKELGFHVTKYRHTSGNIWVVPHWGMEGDTYSGYGFFVDPDHIGGVYLKSSEADWYPAHYDDIQGVDEKAKKGQWYGVCGLELIQERSFGLIKNVIG